MNRFSPLAKKESRNMPTRAAIRLLTFIFLGLLLANPAMAISYNFGVSPSITVIANQTVSIQAAIINTSDTSINFGCAIILCGGLDFGAGISAGPGEGLNALNFQFSPPGGSFNDQFVGLVLAPNETFNFTFGTINFNPSEPVGNPFSTVLHPTLGFAFRNPLVIAAIPITISIGEEIAFAPFIFSASTPVPVPSTLLLFAASIIGLVSWRCKQQASQTP